MLELQNVCKFFNDVAVLKNLDLTVRQGEVLALLGLSGAGKTTLLRCINFLERPDSGKISVGDRTVDCENASKHDILNLRRKTAMVFQNYNLFKNKNAIENVMEGLVIVQKKTRKEARAVAMDMLEKVGLQHRAQAYAHELSGGQQQRVAIARALALQPEVLLLDEPTSALDPNLVDEVLAVIRDIAQTGITMLIVTHEIAFALNVSSRIAFMDGGRILEEGTPGEILRSPREESTWNFLESFRQRFSYQI
jgi:L-cystine transport system ATP-binding protein